MHFASGFFAYHFENAMSCALCAVRFNRCAARHYFIFFTQKNPNFDETVESSDIFLVETRGVEPLSKKSAPRVSPSAVPDRCFDEVSLGNEPASPIPVCFPLRYRTWRKGILHGWYPKGAAGWRSEDIGDQAAKAKSDFAFMFVHRLTGWWDPGSLLMIQELLSKPVRPRL